LPQSALRGLANREAVCALLDHVGVLDEDLLPDIDEWPVAVSSLLRTRRVGSEYFQWIGRAFAE
jgi:hypothetical protein